MLVIISIYLTNILLKNKSIKEFRIESVFGLFHTFLSEDELIIGLHGMTILWMVD